MPTGSAIDPHIDVPHEAAARPPHPDDPINFAAIRFYTNRIENHAIGIYSTCPDVIGQVRDALLECLDVLAELECEVRERYR